MMPLAAQPMRMVKNRYTRTPTPRTGNSYSGPKPAADQRVGLIGAVDQRQIQPSIQPITAQDHIDRQPDGSTTTRPVRKLARNEPRKLRRWGGSVMRVPLASAYLGGGWHPVQGRTTGRGAEFQRVVRKFAAIAAARRALA